MKKPLFLLVSIACLLSSPSACFSEEDRWTGGYVCDVYEDSIGGENKVRLSYVLRIEKPKKAYHVTIHTPSLAYFTMICSESNSKKTLICFPSGRHVEKEDVAFAGKNSRGQIGFKFSDRVKEKLRRYGPGLSRVADENFLYTKVE